MLHMESQKYTVHFFQGVAVHKRIEIKQIERTEDIKHSASPIKFAASGFSKN